MTTRFPYIRFFVFRTSRNKHLYYLKNSGGAVI